MTHLQYLERWEPLIDTALDMYEEADAMITKAKQIQMKADKLERTYYDRMADWDMNWNRR